MVTPRRRALGILVGFVSLVGAATACELDKIVIPRTERRLVVHSILNTSERVQVVIVERMITGGFVTGSTIIDGVERVADANVTITTPTGKVIQVHEEIDTVNSALPGGPPMIVRGEYQFSLDVAQISLTPGGTYTLRIVTPMNEVVTGSTTIPGSASVTSSTTLLFNRERDSLILGWSPTTGAASYWLRIDGGGSSYTQFVGTNRVVIDGSLRTFDEEELKPVFAPGFVSTSTVAAVDRNVYDYFRTGNDPFSGSGLLMYLQGASGVFGSMSIILSTRADVTLDKRHPIEGRYGSTSPTSSTESRRTSDFRLFLDTVAVAGPNQVLLYGTYQRGSNGGRDRVTGVLTGNDLYISLFSGESTVPLWRYRATVRGDTLDGAFVDDGLKAVYVRR